MKQFILALFISFVAAPSFAIEGVYTGHISLFEPAGDLVPLQLSLSFTGERVFTPRGDERPVIDASILVGDEGGPYAASNVSLDVDDSEIDIRYERPKSNLSNTSPSNFRLIGELKANLRIEGRVLSGTSGPVGTFVLEQSESSILTPSIIFKGRWVGEAITTDGGVALPLEITLTPTNDAVLNPNNYEFEYSLGKVGALRWNLTRHAFDRVYVDYLRRKVTMIKSNARGTGGISCEFYLQANGSISGQIQSSLRGTVATFELEPERVAP